MANSQRLPQAQKPKFSLAIQTPSMQNLIRNTLGDADTAKRFIAAISSAVATTPALQECDAGSIISGALLGESLKLSHSPQVGHYYLVPFKNRKDGTTRAVFVPGYKGYIQLATRSGYYSKITVMEVKEGELVSYNPFEDEAEFSYIEDYNQREAAPTIGYFAMFKYSEKAGGMKKVLYWTKEKMLDHADRYSQAFSRDIYAKILAGDIPDKDMWKYSSFWYKNFDEMAKKTMIRQLISKWGYVSVDTQIAFESDNQTIAKDDDGFFVPESPGNDADVIRDVVNAPVNNVVAIDVDEDDDGDLFEDD